VCINNSVVFEDCSTLFVALNSKNNEENMRLIKFIRRFKRNYRVHGNWMTIIGLVKMSWSQSKEKKIKIWFPTEVVEIK